MAVPQERKCGRMGHGEVEEDSLCGVPVQVSHSVVSEVSVSDIDGAGEGLA